MNAKVVGIFLLLVSLCVFLSIFTPESFLKGNNIENLLRRTAMYGILGIGVAFVIITGGIDLSIGSLVCLVACLLAVFLRVSYEPYHLQQVVEVKAATRTITVQGNTDLKPGDTIRYYGGRRARNAVGTITKVETTSIDGSPTSQLVIDQNLSRDDTDGKVAKMYVIDSITTATPNGEQAHSVTLNADLPDLAARDQIWFVSTSGGLKQFVIEERDRKAADDKTRLFLNDSPGVLDGSWSAVPLERQQRASIVVGVAAVLGIALALGALHGLLITRLKLQPFVVTLCGLLFYRGFSRWLVDDRTMGFGNEYDGSLSRLGVGKLPIWEAAGGGDSFGVPYPFFVLLLAAIAAAIFLNRTIWGRYMLALGRNEEAARYSGINTNRMTVLAYVISAFAAAVGGMLFALDSNSVAPSSFGNFFELYAIAAAVLGGCSLRGGEGGILGVVIGTAVMQTLYNLIVLMKISDKLEFAIIGAVILLGVIADELLKRATARRRAAREQQAASESG